jgi:hypothetical protein
MASEYTDGLHHRQPVCYYLKPKVLAEKLHRGKRDFHIADNLLPRVSLDRFDTALRGKETGRMHALLSTSVSIPW